jgi:hypothetical protein
MRVTAATFGKFTLPYVDSWCVCVTMPKPQHSVFVWSAAQHYRSSSVSRESLGIAALFSSWQLDGTWPPAARRSDVEM